jgi:hypothetical protein
MATMVPKTVVDAKGDLIAGTGADAVSRLAVGANGTTLVADSAEATGLKWETPAAGGITLISEVVASAISGLSFSSIPQTYKALYLVYYGLQQSSASEGIFLWRFNNDSGTNYSYQSLFKRGGSAADNNSDNADTSLNGSFTIYMSNATSTLNDIPRGEIRIDNYASTSKFKPWQFDSSFLGNTINFAMIKGAYKSTSAITSIDLVRNGGSNTLTNVANTSIRLYGLS